MIFIFRKGTHTTTEMMSQNERHRMDTLNEPDNTTLIKTREDKK